MVIGRILFSMLQCWLMVGKQIFIHNLFNLFKIVFLWFFLAFSTSYLFFLLCHSKSIASIRKELAIEIARSLGLGFMLATLLVALYECIIGWLARSEFFDIHQAILNHLSISSGSHVIFYQTISFIFVLLSALFAHHFVAPLLECKQHHIISDRYGYCILGLSLMCWIFLWLIL